jgi:NAD(P)-dependent dehydrogenase (short-subunit alcohol dehydrogenase family)
MDGLKNQIAIVTGGSSGFGVGIANELSKAGAKVYIVARNRSKLIEVANNVDAIPIVGDVTKNADWDNIFSEVIEKDRKVDILINNAGSGGVIAEISEQTDDNVQQVIATNLYGAIYGCSRAAKLMKQQGFGTIINISSLCSVEAWSGWGIYAAAKAGLEQITKHLYVELRPYGARATSIIPSWGATDFNLAANLDPFDDNVASRAIQPTDIGKVVVDVCQLPTHLVIPELRLVPLVQKIEPY